MKVVNYFRPTSIEELLKLKKEYSNSKILAGGTVVSRMRFSNSDTLIDIQGLDLNYLRETDDLILIGSMLSISDLANSKINNFDGLLQRAVKHCGPITVRNMATVGGNIMTGYYWNDITGALLSLDADLVFVSKTGVDHVPVGDFIKRRSIFSDKLLKEIMIKKKNKLVFYNRFSRTVNDIPTSIFIGIPGEKMNITVYASTISPENIQLERTANIENECLNILKNRFISDLRGDTAFKKKIVRSQIIEFMEWCNENKL